MTTTSNKRHINPVTRRPGLRPERSTAIFRWVLTAELLLLSPRSDEDEDEDSTGSERGALRWSAHFYAQNPQQSSNYA